MKSEYVEIQLYPSGKIKVIDSDGGWLKQYVQCSDGYYLTSWKRKDLENGKIWLIRKRIKELDKSKLIIDRELHRYIPLISSIVNPI